ncbi:hypothetical protein VCR29J2_710071 [Vibrio coralliirubri]|nr:hypothetical protein VCR29J2_710071 [Vibrio coralliirubri]
MQASRRSNQSEFLFYVASLYTASTWVSSRYKKGFAITAKPFKYFGKSG